MNDLVKEAPYHPGYEDAAFDSVADKRIEELNEFRIANARHLKFSKVIVEFNKSKHGLE